jgi:hypothetical protein
LLYNYVCITPNFIFYCIKTTFFEKNFISFLFPLAKPNKNSPTPLFIFATRPFITKKIPFFYQKNPIFLPKKSHFFTQKIPFFYSKNPIFLVIISQVAKIICEVGKIFLEVGKMERRIEGRFLEKE